MKILFLVVNIAGGGAEKVLVNLANCLAEKGHEVTVRSLADEGVNRSFLSSDIKYEHIFKKAFKGMGLLHKLPHKLIYNKVCHGEFDVIIPYLHGVLTRIVSYAPQKQKTVAWLHADMEKSPFMTQLLKENKAEECFRNYNRIIAVSDTVRNSFLKTVGSDYNVETLYNTFDVRGILAAAKEKCELPAAGLKLVSVGKLEDVKGYERLLEAFAGVIRDGMDCSLTIVGKGPDEAKLRQIIDKHGLGGRVRLAGFDVNPYKYIAAADLFVCSSYTEGFSSVVAESLILGVPVLTTDCSGMAEMLGANNEYGVIVENSEEGLYEGLRRLLGDESLLAHYKAKAGERGAFFEPEATVGAVERMLGEVAGE